MKLKLLVLGYVLALMGCSTEINTTATGGGSEQTQQTPAPEPVEEVIEE